MKRNQVAAAPAAGERAFALDPAPCSRPRESDAPVSAFTVDVEDWYQSCIDFDAPITERVLRNTERILGVLDDARIKGTFFVQGLVADTFPELVATLVAEGHEVQSHGYSHRPLFAMDRSELRNELERARKSVEDAAGRPVTAFRAQDFSIGQGNLWALEVLASVGFEIDSSIFPMRGRRYGIADWPLEPHWVSTGGWRILEVPVAIWERRGRKIPVAGGGYFRILPRTLLERGLRAIVASGRPAVVYCHPYEFNDHELEDYRGRVRASIRLSQGIGRRAFVARIRGLLDGMRFGRFDEVLSAWGIA